MKKNLLFVLFIFFAAALPAQSWVDVWLNSNADLSTKQAAFNNFYQGKDLTQLKGWKPFKRWEYNLQRRMLAGETEADVKQRYLNYFLNNTVNSNNVNSSNATAHTNSIAGTWSFIGPGSIPTSGGGAGRVTNFTTNGTNQIFVGAPAGGLWRRDGTAWVTTTDFQLSFLGISDIIIHPTNSTIYCATGDADAGDAPSIGVIKSTDGGLTWTSVGLTNQSRIYKMIPMSADYQTIIACTNTGIHRTTNGGTSWTQVLTSSTVHDMEVKTDNNNTVFAVTATGYYISNDGGVSFTNATSASNLPTTGTNRKAIAVTPANPNLVYIIAGRSDNSGFHSFWKSTDGGNTFNMSLNGLMAGAPNLLGWSSAGTDAVDGGQSWYDLAIAAHPTDANTVYVGGVNIWRSSNGGDTWGINGHWTGSGGAPYVHADIHNLDFLPNGNLYASSDGGLFVNTATTGVPNWSDLSEGLHIAQMYRMGISQITDGRVIAGHQDNGTNLRNLATDNWRRVIGGDGFESAIDPTNDNNMWGEIYYGAIRKSTNGGTNWSSIVSSGGTGGTVSENGPWLTEFAIAKSNPSIMYVAKSNVYRNTSGGSGGAATWTNGVGISPSGAIQAMAVSPTNENTVYIAKGANLYVTTDGTNFILKSSGLPGNTINYIAVGTSPSIAYCVVAGATGNKVYKTINGGDTWSNISGTTLPNITPQCIAVDLNSNVNQLYIGHLNGVYTRNDTMANWRVFNNGLPNTEVTELEIMTSAAKIVASTYGRGAWVSDLYSNAAAPCTFPPVANFAASATSVCPGNTVSYTNSTVTCATATYSWSFPGGTPSTSTAQTPSVVYNTPGTYAVTLVATNGNGSNTKTTNSLIVVNPILTQTGSISVDRNDICSNENVSFTFAGTNNGSTPTVTWFKNNAAQGSNSSITLGNLTNGDVIRATVTASANAGCVSNATFNTNSITMIVRQQPAKPVITQNIGDLISSATSNNQWFNNGTVLTGSTTTTIHPLVNGTYTVQTTANGCLSPMSDPIVLRIEGINALYPNPSRGNSTFDFYTPVGATEYNASIYNAGGKLVWQESKSVTPGLNRINLKLFGAASGTYNLKLTVGSQTYTKPFVIGN